MDNQNADKARQIRTLNKLNNGQELVGIEDLDMEFGSGKIIFIA